MPRFRRFSVFTDPEHYKNSIISLKWPNKHWNLAPLRNVKMQRNRPNIPWKRRHAPIWRLQKYVTLHPVVERTSGHPIAIVKFLDKLNKY